MKPDDRPRKRVSSVTAVPASDIPRHDLLFRTKGADGRREFFQRRIERAEIGADAAPIGGLRLRLDTARCAASNIARSAERLGAASRNIEASA